MRNELDPRPILSALGVADGALTTRITGGWDTALWRVEQTGAVYGLRVFRPEQPVTCRRDLLAMRAAAASGIPVPAIHGQTVWRDRPALFLSWCAGRPLRTELLAHLWRTWALGLDFGRM